MFSYLKSLIKRGTGDSSKSFSLVLSAVMGGLIGLCVCFVLIWDTVDDGYILTDLDSLGWFLLCSGCYMFGGGMSKVLGDKYEYSSDSGKYKNSSENNETEKHKHSSENLFPQFERRYNDNEEKEMEGPHF